MNDRIEEFGNGILRLWLTEAFGKVLFVDNYLTEVECSTAVI